MKSIKFLAVAVIVTAAVPAFAATKTANLPISANVIANCTITTTPVAFGNYDPVVANAAADLDAAGSVTVACTRGIVGLTVDLDNGLVGTRDMQNGAERLDYQLYTDATRSTVWGTGVSPGVVTPAGTTLPVYGRVPQAQDVAVGAYNDTVVATINY